MSYAIVYSSVTGNTAQLAKCISSVLPSEECIYFGEPKADAMKADVLFVGSWTDKGTCCPEIAEFLNGLKDKKVYLFGTAGFGGSSSYFDQIVNRMLQNLSSGNVLLGYYLCQGKMPQAVRTRYEAIAKTDPQKAQPMLENFDQALSRPNQEDIEKLEEAVAELLKKMSQA